MTNRIDTIAIRWRALALLVALGGIAAAPVDAQPLCSGQVCSEDQNPLDEQERQSHEANQRAYEQSQRDAQQREEDWNYAVRSTQQPTAPGRAPRAQGYARPVPRQTPGVTNIDPSDPVGAALQRGDKATAFRMVHDAAENKRVLNAMKVMGNFYEDGLGTPRNFPQAVRWYRACADLGAATCQLELSRVYFNGIGVPRDPVESYKWMLIANRPGGYKQSLTAQNSGFQRDNAARLRNGIAMMPGGMTAAQLAEAKRRYQSWTPPAQVQNPEQAAPPRGR